MLHSTMIAKIDKARRYAEEMETRIVFNAFDVTLGGDHREHRVTFDRGNWTCDCETFANNGYCTHTMAMERVVGYRTAPAPSPEGHP